MRLRSLLPSFVALAAAWLLVAPLSGQSTQPGQARRFSIDAAQSQITVTLTHEGMLRKLHPTNQVAVKTFSGEITLPRDERQTAVTLEAEAKSLANADKEISDFERREFQFVLHNKVLESERHPRIKFQSVSVTDLTKSGDRRSFTLNGDLTLRGETRRVAFPVNATFAAEQLRATGEAKIKQSDFNIKPYADAFGAVKIGDELKINFSIVAKTF